MGLLYAIVHKLDKQCDHCGVHQLLLLNLKAIQVRDDWFHFSEVQAKMVFRLQKGAICLIQKQQVCCTE